MLHAFKRDVQTKFLYKELATLRRRREDNIKMDLTEIGYVWT
jgi:hypothetical protein